jgi:mono/diheme cytochrome c family protein
MEASMVKAAILALVAGASLALATGAVAALTPADLLKGYEASARQDASSFAGFSAERGRAFFQSTHGNDWSCASCHTRNPAASGRLAKTSKTIAPLAPAANPERFTSIAEVEKWFKRNCNDVLGRACTAQEKGDVLAYLMHIAAGGGR